MLLWQYLAPRDMLVAGAAHYNRNDFFPNFGVKFGDEVHLGGKQTGLTGFLNCKKFQPFLGQKTLRSSKTALAVPRVLYYRMYYIFNVHSFYFILWLYTPPVNRRAGNLQCI